MFYLNIKKIKKYMSLLKIGKRYIVNFSNYRENL